MKNSTLESHPTVRVEGESLSYKLVRSKKRKYSLSMKVTRTGQLQVNVPFKTPESEIEAFVLSKIAWIKSNISKHQNRTQTPKHIYQDGELHRYLGCDYPLKCISSTQSKVELSHGCLYLYHRKNASLKNILNHWYRITALQYFTNRTLQLAEKFNLPKINDIKVRYMKARWGSCSSHSVITYNVHLIKTSTELIDYVIIHELCHLLQPNHGPQFYQLQTQLNPNWKAQKRYLNSGVYNI